jgi:hypothetical protein
MAVDTRNKRASVIGIALAAISVFPNPDGAIDTGAERQQTAYCYSGILAGELQENIVEGFEFTLPPNKMQFTMQAGNEFEFTLSDNKMQFTLRDQD